jgi:hypothetical protein
MSDEYLKGIMEHKAPEPVISSHLPDLVNHYISIRAQRLELDRQSKIVKEAEDDLQKVIISKMREQDFKVLGSNTGTVKLHESDEPVAENWSEIWDYVKANDAWELLHKRITVTAIKERWGDGIAIPGVGKVTTYKLTVSKA